MFLSNTGFIKNIFAQSGCLLMTTVSNLNFGDCFNFGLSGVNGAENIKLLNGKIFNNSNNIVGFYNQKSSVEIGLIASTTQYSVIANDSRIIWAQSRLNTGILTYLYAKVSGSCSLDYSLSGRQPVWSITQNYYAKSGNQVTGFITNNDNAPLIFYTGYFMESGFNFGPISNSGIISTGSSVNFVITPNSGATNYNPQYVLETNFGTIMGSLFINTTGTPDTTINYGVNGGSSIIDGGESYWNISSDPFVEDDIYVKLSHVSGSGIFNSVSDFSGYNTGIATGLISGFGYLNLISVFNGTGNSPYYGQEAGSYTGKYTIPQYATGNFSTTISFLASGFVTGNGYTGMGTGIINKAYSNTIIGSSGSFIISDTFTGTPTGAKNLYPAYFMPATGLVNYNVPDNHVTSDILYVGSQYKGIVFGFHYNSRVELVSYLNNNKNVHRVSAVTTGANQILVSSIFGDYGNTIITRVDSDNDGTMSVNQPTLAGEIYSGYNLNMTPVGTFTGKYSGVYVNTGSYSKNVSGIIYGSGLATQEIRNFKEIWNISTGYFPITTVDYTPAQYSFTGGYMGYTHTFGNISVKITYQKSSAYASDISQLFISGSKGIIYSGNITGTLY